MMQEKIFLISYLNQDFLFFLDFPDNESGKEKVDWNDVLREKKSDLQLMIENAKETLRNQPVRKPLNV